MYLVQFSPRVPRQKKWFLVGIHFRKLKSNAVKYKNLFLLHILHVHSSCRAIRPFCFRLVTFSIMMRTKRRPHSHDRQRQRESHTYLYTRYTLFRYILFPWLKLSINSGWCRKIKMHLNTWQNLLKKCRFGQNLDFIPNFCQYEKTTKKRGWAKTRAIVPRHLIWNAKVWSPYRSEIRWHSWLVFLPITPSTLIHVLKNILRSNRKHYEPGKFWDPSFPVVKIDPWKVYHTHQHVKIKRRRTFAIRNKTKTTLWNSLGWDGLLSGIVLLRNTPCDRPAVLRYGYLGAEKTKK